MTDKQYSILDEILAEQYTRGSIYHSTHIFIGGNKTPFEIYKPIEEVITILKGE